MATALIVSGTCCNFPEATRRPTLIFGDYVCLPAITLFNCSFDVESDSVAPLT
jgi:hypothetical protein